MREVEGRGFGMVEVGVEGGEEVNRVWGLEEESRKVKGGLGEVKRVLKEAKVGLGGDEKGLGRDGGGVWGKGK